MTISYASSKMTFPERMEVLLLELGARSLDTFKVSKFEIWFLYNGNLIRYYCKKDWFTGKGVTDGRGLQNLLNQLK